MNTTAGSNHTVGGSNHTAGSNHTGGSSSSWGSGGGGGGSGYGSAAYNAAVAARQLTNQATLRRYACCLCVLILFFTFIHWTRRAFVSLSSYDAKPGREPSRLTWVVVSISRKIRGVMVRKLKGFNSMGHGVLVFVWVAVNIVLTFTNIDLTKVSDVATRFGWMTAGNLALVVFLSLKNTPLAFLTAYSYERINNLHRIAGCTMFTFMCCHAITYTSYFASIHELSVVDLPPQRAAITAGFSFLFGVISSMFVRHVRYELFYITHVMFFIIGIVCVGFHQPDFGKGIVIVVIFAATIWLADRALRASRVLLNSFNNDATVYPLPNGGTRIVLKKPPSRAMPGKHCFVWIPHIRLFEMHPFTIVGTKPLEFCVKAHDGFTWELHEYARRNPGGRLKASVEGPYGTFPDPMDYDKIILIAGGSGGSFTFGLAVNLLERMGEDCTKSIMLIWAVREHENLAWFAEHLRTLRNHVHSPKVAVSLYVTKLDPAGDLLPDDAHRLTQRSGTMSSRSTDSHTPASPDVEKDKDRSTFAGPQPLLPAASAHQRNPLDHEDPEKDSLSDLPAPAAPRHIISTTTLNNSTTNSHTDLVTGSNITVGTTAHVPLTEKAATDEVEDARQPSTPNQANRDIISAATRNTNTNNNNNNNQKQQHRISLHHAVTRGRPDAATLIREAVDATPRHRRVLVAACGPAGMMRAVRDTAADCIRPDGPGVELHCEQFGW